MIRLLPLLICRLTCLLACLLPASTLHADISFQRQVRSILSDKCFQCHGPDAQDRQAGLRLDDETAAKQELDSGDTAIVAGWCELRQDLRHFRLDRILACSPETGQFKGQGEALAVCCRWERLSTGCTQLETAPPN